MPLPNIETLDVDGALRETEDAVAGDTRAVFFRKAAVGGGAALTSGAILGMLPELALGAKRSRKQDVAILNYALTLEYLEANFYERALEEIEFTRPGAPEFTQLVAAHERGHANTLKQLLGKKAMPEPTFDFSSAFDTEVNYLETSYTLENTGVSAYAGQAKHIQSRALLTAAATILSVEARHAAAIATIIGDQPFDDRRFHSITPDGLFDIPKTRKTITKAVKATGFIQE